MSCTTKLDKKNLLDNFSFEITTAAIEHFSKILAQQGPNVDLRIWLSGIATSAAEVEIEYCYAGEAKPTDFKMAFDNITVYIDDKALPYLHQGQIDYEVNDLESSLSIKAPHLRPKSFPDNATFREKIEFLFQTDINDVLAGHGGRVDLIDVQGNDIYIKFSGGCQGCSMVSITLKSQIEQKLRDLLPDIAQIIDVTMHKDGEQPYYS